MNSQIAITLLKDLEQSLDDYCELNDEGKTAFSMAITALELFGISEQLPSVQPEIIRCKDCKHYMQTDTIHHRGWCWRWNHFTAIERYCSERALRGDSDE